ncbi:MULTISPECIES: Coq4 family protein [Prochlorococcus]|uniref:Coq4 family protein n=1 Tax=Prochlorococcus TaxID=1218 RepID=UPI0007B3F7E2|nr:MULTISPECIES: Coq4 family protein [Prochlorococcus]KZR62543.1 Coenzyme Q (ubiquinone) biosynthesis protein Coq4 [Prochlorococcus marinus str. MIT 1312]KZR80974.1 Coenzyme Q (ubiquinone) biosynthesis protein Coq4 [Prochlorococcus marinus str. MIT 1327]NMO84203.1 hypothetical protein [Prochlorococcus sp. P1344]NMP05209.1 hypothetical protein [Prochlorococcus sp. P1361]NMP05228.1 hypothetical protein [Prochlorococcus sp. P1361]
MNLNLRKRLQNLKLVACLANFLKDPGLDSVFAVAGNLKNSPLAEKMESHLMANARFQEMVKEDWRPKPIDLNDLQKLPQGSLDRSYADQLLSQGIDPNGLIDPTPVTSPKEFIVHRLKETHDIVHVLTGFGIDGVSELGLQGFNLAQNHSPLAVMLIFGGMLNALQDDEPLGPLLQALSQGFQMGLDADLVIAHKLEEGWERPLVQWREELRLPHSNAS